MNLVKYATLHAVLLATWSVTATAGTLIAVQNVEYKTDYCTADPAFGNPVLCEQALGRTMAQAAVSVFQNDNDQDPTTWTYRYQYLRVLNAVDTTTIKTPDGTCSSAVWPVTYVPSDPAHVPFGTLTGPPTFLNCITFGSPPGAIVMGIDMFATQGEVGSYVYEWEFTCPPGRFESSVIGSPGNPLTEVAGGEADILAPSCEAPVTDTDADGQDDSQDNCTLVANGAALPDGGGFAQRDTDGDGYGNVCDGDFDNDGDTDDDDLTILQAGFLGNQNPDTDLDGDGATNYGDLSLFGNLYGNPPGPSAFAP